MQKYLINILKDKDFEEIVIADACIYKEGEYFIVSASYSECKLSKKLYRYLKLNGLNTKVRIADNKTPNKKKIDKLYQGIDMNPVSWTQEKRGFYMSKLTYEDKINIYIDKKGGMSIGSLSSKYKVSKNIINYLTALIDKHGIDILRTDKNRIHTKFEKQEAIDRVLINGEAKWAVALDLGLLSKGMLVNWIKNYKEMSYNIVERKRGRSPTMSKKPKITNKIETIEEENERLKKENLYLKAELEYSKKLRAVVQARKNQQQKKK